MIAARPGARARLRLSLWSGLLCAEFIAIATAYQLLTSLECAATDAEFACRSLRELAARAIAVSAGLVLCLLARREGRADFARAIAGADSQTGWAALHCAGFAAIFAPLLLGPGLAPRFSEALWPMLGGAAAAGLGALFWLAPPAAWRDWLARGWRMPAAVLALGLALPDLANLALPVWERPELTRATFFAAALVLHLGGFHPLVVPEADMIGVDGFTVDIAPQCSGVEGFALILGFAALYAALFRRETRMGRFWLLMVPLAILASWALNVLRIAALVLLGARVSPELAVNGFHSYAGWLLFTGLALTLLALARRLPFLAADPRGQTRSRWREDPRAARILPLAAAMLAGAIIPALSTVPGLLYPLRIASVAPVLWFFRRHYAALLATRLDPLALGAGALIGGVWFLTRPAAPDPALAAALAALPPAAFVLWAGARLLGAALVTPLVEELFFRGYLLDRLARAGWPRALAVIASSLLFALPHGRFLAAFAAGSAFALIALGRGLAPAIQAHALANLALGLAAVGSGDWGAF